MTFSPGKLFLLGVVATTIIGCTDLVSEEDDASSACEAALNDRDYDTAISICDESDDEGRANKAAAFMGQAGFDIANLLSAESVSASKDANETDVLGTEDVSFANIALNVLKLDSGTLSEESIRIAAIQSSKQSLESAIDLLSPVNASRLTVDEIVLELLSSVYAIQLELILLLDVGQATSLDPSNTSELETSVATLALTGGSHLITTLKDGTDISTALKKADGRIWTNEQNLALLPSSVLGFELGGNLTQICESLGSATSNTTTPPGKSFTTLLTQITTAVGKFGSLSGSDSLSDLSDAIDTANSLEDELGAACSTFAEFL